MKKRIDWCKTHALFVASLALLAFIPLYPKLPLVDIKNTWVYVRIEDVLVLGILAWWGTLLLRRKVTLRTPLSVPILGFWLAGAVATLHGILLIFPSIPGVFANVAFLSFLRRIEYMSVFFIAFSAVTKKDGIIPVAATTIGTLLLVSIYGLGQKYAGWPAYLTMNEEFAKGVPLTLSSLSRVSSTFGGHYDLAAYLVLVIPIAVSLLFAVRNFAIRAILAAASLLGLIVLMMTVSRISLFAALIAIGLVVFYHNRRVVLLLIPAGILGLIMAMGFFPQLMERYGNTIKEVDVLVDAQSGGAIGHVTIVPRQYFQDKTVWQRFFLSISDAETKASPAAAYVVPMANLADQNVLLTEPAAPTGEDLPSGSGYINLTLSPVTKRIGNFLYEPARKTATQSAVVHVINGQYLVKKAFAYDLSFTTRFQGEWPNALAAFRRNVIVGSGYGSVSLAVDNSYLRMLAEVGALGFAAFLSIFLSLGLYLRYTWSAIESPLVRSFSMGFVMGIIGLSINAIFIDVFEASKVAFVLWLLAGFVVGSVQAYAASAIRLLPELKKLATSTAAIALYLLIAVIVLYSQMTRNYFVGDDFTWFRWAATCKESATVLTSCPIDAARIVGYFTHSDGFFYRPGTKLFFLLMYRTAWLNPSSYHMVSMALHFGVSVLVFLLGLRLLRDRLWAVVAAFLFVGLSGFAEAVFWASSVGLLFTAFFGLLSLLLYASHLEQGGRLFFAGSVLSVAAALVFHELGIVVPLLLIVYRAFLVDGAFRPSHLVKRGEVWLAVPVVLYLMLRFVSGSHWFNGDYSYNVIKLPFNAVGNAIGYFLMSIAGTYGLPLAGKLRSVFRESMGIAAAVLVLGSAGIAAWLPRLRTINAKDKKLLGFLGAFFVIALLPFLGLGNLAPRYGYFAAVGVVIMMAMAGKTLFAVLSDSGSLIAGMTVATLFSVIFLLQVVGIQQLHTDWFEAGENVRRFLVSIEGQYHDYWATEPIELHLVDVPIRHRDAWVFPVGLSDAVWFATQNPRIRVYQWPTVSSALKAVTYGNALQKVYVFDSEGRVRPVSLPEPKTP